MNSKSARLNEALGYVDERYLDLADAAAGQPAAAGIRKAAFRGRHAGRTLLLAAAVAALLTVAAFAIGYSVHQRRQAELRQALRIDQSHVTSYVEYETSATDKGGVTILSALRDGKFQTLYVNISPVEKTEAASLSETMLFHFSVDGENWGIATPLENGYDEETRTLTVACNIHLRYLEGLDSAELQIARIDSAGLEGSGTESPGAWIAAHDALLGTARFTPTEQEMRFVTFSPTVITDENTGREVTVLALELFPTGAVWHLRYAGAEELYNARGTLDATARELLRAEEYVLNHATLRFLDGAAFAPGGALSGGYTDGVVLLYTGWEKAVDINALESVAIDGAALPII